MEEQNNKQPQFNGRNEQEGIKKAAQEERSNNNKDNVSDVTSTGNDLSLGNSIRNDGDVSGTTFGDQSNPAKFSNLSGGGNQNNSDRAAGEGGTGYAGYLYEAEIESLSESLGDALNAKPSGAMQGNNKEEGGSGS